VPKEQANDDWVRSPELMPTDIGEALDATLRAEPVQQSSDEPSTPSKARSSLSKTRREVKQIKSKYNETELKELKLPEPHKQRAFVANLAQYPELMDYLVRERYVLHVVRVAD
jgi:hypothetical protein